MSDAPVAAKADATPQTGDAGAPLPHDARRWSGAARGRPERSSAQPESAPPETVALLYDYSKHLLSLALLGLGGVVSLSQSPQGQRIPRLIVSMMLGCLALSGLCSLSCTATILKARRRDRPVGASAWASSQGAMLFLGLGVGGFITIWIKAAP